MTRYRVASRKALGEGVLKGVKAGETDVLLVRLAGSVHALYGRCTHNGAPLEKGILDGERLICPWHHACFAAKTGALLEPPALDDLPRYETGLEGDDIWVEIPENVADTQTPTMATRDETDARVFVILGAGAAGLTAAQTLRQEGFGGRVLLVSAEAELPYDRTVLSKDYLASSGQGKDQGAVALRNRTFLEMYGLELLTGHEATALDPAGRTVTFKTGETLAYDALLLAPGSVPTPLALPGSDLSGIHYLRTLADAQALSAGAKEGSRVVIIGASFIGLECAASLRERGLEVTVVTPDPVPFADLFGREVGEMLKDLHHENGVTLLTEREISGFGGDEAVGEVRLIGGDALEADLVLVGTGVQPALGWLDSVPKRDDGSLRVDARLRVLGAQDGLYAAGDVATFPLPLTGEAARIEHWRLAMQHGQTAARTMLGQDAPLRSAPFFWSKQYDLNLRYVGHAPGWDETVIDGDLSAREALVYYLREGRLVAALGVQRDAELCAVEACMEKKRVPPASVLRQKGVDWLAWLEQTNP